MLKKIGKRFVWIQPGVLFINSADTVLKKVSLANGHSKAVFQLVSLAPLVSGQQVLAGAEQAVSAVESGTAISDKLEFELLLRLAGRRQIGESLKLLALKGEGNVEAVLVGVGLNGKQLQKEAQILGQTIGFRPNPKLFEKNFQKNKNLILKEYGISPQQIASFENRDEKGAIESLVLEKMALVSLEE